MAGQLCVGEFSARLRNRAAEFAGGFDPFVDDAFSILHRFGIGFTVRHAAWQLRDFDNEAVVVFAPVDDQFVARRHFIQASPRDSLKR
jgi:hypothetical protein